MSKELIGFIIFKLWVPIIILLLVFTLPYYFLDLAMLLITVIQIDASSIEETIKKFTDNQLLMKLIIGLVLSYLFLTIIRNNNKERVFNISNIYYNMDYFYFLIAAKLLGYTKVNLVNVPIYLHFLICFKGHFQEVIFADTEDIDATVDVQLININNESDTINIIIKDTYDITENMLPDTIKDLPTLIVDNYINTNNQRLYNKNLEKELKIKIDKHSVKYPVANIFATTNTKTSKSLIDYCFKTAGRIGFKKIYVFKQERNLMFKEKVLVYKTKY